MNEINDILVVLDSRLPHSLAIQHAKLIANITKSHLHLLICSGKEEAGDYLKKCRDELFNEGYIVSSQQISLDKPHKDVIAVQRTRNCQMVIKQHVPESALRRAIITPDDWQLLRNCPVPVLMVKTRTAWRGGSILAAVDVGNSDGEHRALNTGILSAVRDIAALADCGLHVVCAYPSPMLGSADPVFQLKETIEHRYKNRLVELQHAFVIGDEHVHLEQGPAEVIIPFVANKLKVGLTVIGSVGRTGLSASLFGNTAEKVLDTLECDVLVIKPEDVFREMPDKVKHLVGQ
ncbi:universal stress protein [Pseudomonas sp. GV071]|jgi:nucleotide-binding universal stress UspA family protein|uniref:universal stress protein n=1 Tax=Pseudomonas sp. GV071 TaxID=2135754 RepID=UPI000D3B3841|nr:universal stress protein [Pseudomonas sp. GV071]PTQ74340.1 nucleotide-binding universal stress UspA family protein [Pseudomonas sp. GV071]